MDLDTSPQLLYKDWEKEEEVHHKMECNKIHSTLCNFSSVSLHIISLTELLSYGVLWQLVL